MGHNSTLSSSSSWDVELLLSVPQVGADFKNNHSTVGKLHIIPFNTCFEIVQIDVMKRKALSLNLTPVFHYPVVGFSFIKIRLWWHHVNLNFLKLSCRDRAQSLDLPPMSQLVFTLWTLVEAMFLPRCRSWRIKSYVQIWSKKDIFFFQISIVCKTSEILSQPFSFTFVDIYFLVALLC